MPSVSDFKTLYEQKCLECEDLQQQFNEIEHQSNLIMNDLDDEIKQLKKKNDHLQKQVKQLKQKKKYIASTIERQLDQAQKQKNDFKNRFKDFQKKVIQLQIINQDLQNELRATKATLQQYQASSQRTMQQLAILRVELQQSTTSNQQQIERLRQQLKETEQQIFVMHRRTKKKSEDTNNEKAQQKWKREGESGIVSVLQTPLKMGKQQMLNQKTYTPQQTYRTSVHQSAFKQTLKEIRSYIQTMDVRKEEIRKNLLTMQKQNIYSSPVA